MAQHISTFVRDNRKELASFIRQKMVQAGAEEYVRKLGRDGIIELEKEAVGLPVDIACALTNRLKPDAKLSAEELLAKLPPEESAAIRLPRSEAYQRVRTSLRESVEKNEKRD